MSIGPVYVSNQALYKIGEKKPLVTWPDPSTNGTICKQFFDTVRDEVLESEDWKCATDRAKLAQLTDAPAFEYDYQYQLPNDCLRPLIICDENGKKLTVKWEVEGRNLLTSLDEVYIKYIKREIDLNKWTPTLLKVFVLKMAIELITPLGKSRSILQNLALELTEIALPTAEISNARIGYVADENGDSLAIEAGR